MIDHQIYTRFRNPDPRIEKVAAGFCCCFVCLLGSLCIINEYIERMISKQYDRESDKKRDRRTIHEYVVDPGSGEGCYFML